MKNYQKLLAEINMPNLKFLGKGMQSTVFELDKDYVLKIYGVDIGIKNLKRLKSFYESLDTEDVTFHTPLLTDIKEVGTKLLVTEKKLQGRCPGMDAFKDFPATSLKKYLSSYVESLFSIQRIKTSFLNIAEPLDLTGDFFTHKSYKNWEELITTALKVKYFKNQDIFDLKVKNAPQLIEKLINKVQSFYVGNNYLIHGDFFPANTMINEDMKITSLLDFGILTTIGDPIFDIALGATFSDMYGQVTHFKIKEFVCGLVKERISKEDYDRTQIYILIYSFISANMYRTNDPTDGHFTWCINNLNNSKFLKFL